MSTLNIISWNIAGCRPVHSEQMFDYAAEDHDYFAQQLSAFKSRILTTKE